MKKIITMCILILSLTGCTLYIEESKNATKNESKDILSSEKALELIKEKYEQMEKSYTEISGTYPTIIEDNKTYYTLVNYEELTKIYNEKMLKKYNEENNIIQKENSYYSYLLPKTKAEYDDISYTEISITENKIKYNILLYKCVEKKDEKCNNSTLTTNQFELEKENNEWKISNYEVN